MTETQQQALAAALIHLFGEGLEVQSLQGGFRFSWQGEEYGSFIWQQGDWGQQMALDNIIPAALNTAHDTVLEGMGYAGIHPGELAASQPYAQELQNGYRLFMGAADGQVFRSVTLKWP